MTNAERLRADLFVEETSPMKRGLKYATSYTEQKIVERLRRLPR